MEQDVFHAPHLSDKLPRSRIPWTGREDRRLSAGLDPAAGREQPAPRHPGGTRKSTTSTSTTSSRRPPLDRLPRNAGGLDELTSALQPGDRLVVSELSRLGRSLGQVVAVLDALAKGSLGVSPARRQGGGNPSLPRAGRLQDRPRQDLTGVSRTALYSFMTTRGLRPRGVLRALPSCSLSFTVVPRPGSARRVVLGRHTRPVDRPGRPARQGRSDRAGSRGSRR